MIFIEKKPPLWRRDGLNKIDQRPLGADTRAGELNDRELPEEEVLTGLLLNVLEGRLKLLFSEGR